MHVFGNSIKTSFTFRRKAPRYESCTVLISRKQKSLEAIYTRYIPVLKVYSSTRVIRPPPPPPPVAWARTHQYKGRVWLNVMFIT